MTRPFIGDGAGFSSATLESAKVSGWDVRQVLRTSSSLQLPQTLPADNLSKVP